MPPRLRKGSRKNRLAPGLLTGSAVTLESKKPPTSRAPIGRREGATDLELDLWRLLGSPEDLPAAFAQASERLRSEIALEAAELWSIDPAHDRLARLAATDGAGPPMLRSHAVVELALACFEGPVVRVLDTSHPLAVACGWRKPAIACALREERRPTGLLVVHGADPIDTSKIATLLGPFAGALVHARRLDELSKLRDAAEADKHALLTRLHREAIVESIVGERGGLREVMQRVAQVAATDAPVLLLGETGSGKEVIARAIHERSARHDGPMVRVNCGAIAPELIDSELFGHERGSFTGAIGARKGWFERAHGGTLLLDEVGELPLAAQVRLLRVLQDGTLSRVGGEKPISVDVRIVAATHRDLRAMAERGEFREDLWYRLSVFPLRLPSLRERREDIPLLASHFAARIGERLGGAPLVPSSADLSTLMAYDWPGNVRELAAVIERAAILGHAKRLDVASALGAVEPATAPAVAKSPPPVESGPFPTLDEAMRRHIERALQHTRGRIEGPRGAAAILGINPHTLRSRMRKLRVDWDRFRA